MLTKLVRSIVLLTLLISVTLIVGVVMSPLLLTCNSKKISLVALTWGKIIVWGMRVFLGVKVKLEGLKNLPKSPFIVASKHQSAYETFFYTSYFKGAAFIFKKELLYIPIYGLYMKYISIPIERGSVSAIKKVAQGAKQAFSNNRILCIFPEGTRIPYGKNGEVKPGIYMVHAASPDTPIVPVAVNSGKIWPKGTFATKPGTITIKFLPPIVGKHSKDELLPKLEKILNEESNKL